MTASRLALLLAALALGPTAARAAIDPHAPADTQLYVAIDLRQTFDSEFFKENLLEPARDLIKQVEGANEVLRELGLDPFKDIDRLVISSPGAKEQDRGLLVAYGRFDADKFKKRVERLKKDADEGVKLHDVPLGAGAKHTVYEVAVPGTEVAAYVALKDGKTLLLSPGKDYVVDALKAGRDGKKPELKSKELQALIERLEVGKQALTVALPGGALAGADDVVPGAAAALKGIEAVGGGLTFARELRLDLAITAATEENALE
ncbi:MAG: hypothetical protein ACRC33_02575, partial [Gemmataceae bacterium]